MCKHAQFHVLTFQPSRMERSDVQRIQRKNTTAEIQTMRKERRKRKRLESEVSVQAVAEQERELMTKAQVEVWKYKRMSRSFWERWQWELQLRKEYLQVQKKSRSIASGSGITNTTILEIDPKHLLLPPSMHSVDECYIGRGSFGIVKVQLYRGISVAVREACQEHCWLMYAVKLQFLHNSVIPTYRTLRSHIVMV